MATTQPRLNITLEKQYLTMLEDLAKKEHKSLSATAKHLILQALELNEDLALSQLATLRDKGKKETISHDKTWDSKR